MRYSHAHENTAGHETKSQLLSCTLTCPIFEMQPHAKCISFVYLASFDSEDLALLDVQSSMYLEAGCWMIDPIRLHVVSRKIA